MGPGRPDPNLAVMQYLRVAGAHFGGGDPQIPVEVAFNEDELVIDGSLCGQVKVLGHFDDDVRLDVPSVGELERGRGVVRVAFGSALVHPGNERVEVRSAQRFVIRKRMSALWFGKPGWHLPRDDRGLDRLGPRAGVGKREQRHGCHFAGTMASLTVLLQDRENILAERDRARVGSGEGRDANQTTDQGNSYSIHSECLRRRPSTASQW